MKTKFTKGTWSIQDDGYGLIGVLFRKGFGVLVGRKDSESIANANLIACAPEMYEMLKMLLDGDSINDHSIDAEVSALLRKARGESAD